MTAMTQIRPGRLLAAAILGASAVVVIATPQLWHEAAPPHERAILGVWLIGAIASFIYAVGHRPRRAPLRWLARPAVGPVLAAAAAVAVLADRLHWL